MPITRRKFLGETSLAALAASIAPVLQAQDPAEPVPGEPSAFGTAAPVGPPVSEETFAQAEKLVQVQMSAAERQQAAATWASDMAPVYERRTGPKKLELPPGLAPVLAVESRAPRAGGRAGEESI